MLNKKIAKSGLDISDLSEELQEVKREEEEEGNRPFQMPSELTSVDLNEKPPTNAEEYILNEIELIKFQNENHQNVNKANFPITHSPNKSLKPAKPATRTKIRRCNKEHRVCKINKSEKIEEDYDVKLIGIYDEGEEIFETYINVKGKDKI